MRILLWLRRWVQVGGRGRACRYNIFVIDVVIAMVWIDMRCLRSADCFRLLWTLIFAGTFLARR